jgi:hypothetical protein
MLALLSVSGSQAVEKQHWCKTTCKTPKGACGGSAAALAACLQGEPQLGEAAAQLERYGLVVRRKRMFTAAQKRRWYALEVCWEVLGHGCGEGKVCGSQQRSFALNTAPSFTLHNSFRHPALRHLSASCCEARSRRPAGETRKHK